MSFIKSENLEKLNYLSLIMNYTLVRLFLQKSCVIKIYKMIMITDSNDFLETNTSSEDRTITM